MHWKRRAAPSRILRLGRVERFCRDRPEESWIQREGSWSKENGSQICSSVSSNHASDTGVYDPYLRAGFSTCCLGLRAGSSWSILLSSFLLQGLVQMPPPGSHCTGDFNTDLRNQHFFFTSGRVFICSCSDFPAGGSWEQGHSLGRILLFLFLV